MSRDWELDIVERQVEHQAHLTSERASPAAWLLLAVLFITYICSTLDRFVISLLIDPIKADLHITDTQISLLQGLAFSLIFAIATLPVGFLVDRVNRRRLIAIGVAFWSLMNSLCGLATNFTQLFVARGGVGVGEAVLSPASYSLISDAFPKRKHGLALGIYTAGGAAGSGLSLLIGGFVVAAIMRYGVITVPLLGTLQPWQTSFIVISAPGFLIALLILFLREPSRNNQPAEPRKAKDNSQLWRFLRGQRRTLILHHLAAGFSSMVALGALSWVAPMFMRVHGWSVSEAGFGAGLAFMIGGTIGLVGGGAVSDAVMKRGPHWRLIVCSAATLLAIACAVSYPLVQSPIHALILYGALVMLAILPNGVANAALQFITPSPIRGSVSAIYHFTMSVVNMIGPTLIAIVADQFFPFPHGIRYALAIVLPSCLIVSSVLFAVTARGYRYDPSLEGDMPPVGKG